MKHIAGSLPGLSDIESLLSAPEVADLPTLKLVVLRNVTVEPIDLYLRYRALELGMNAEVTFGGHDTYMQEALNGTSELQSKDLDATLIFTPLPALSMLLSDMFCGLTQAQIEQEVDRVGQVFTNVLKGIRAQDDAMILWHLLEPLLYPAPGQASVVSQLNDMLSQALGAAGNAFPVDMGACLTRLGADAFYDLRYWHLAMAPYSANALAEISSEVFKILRASLGQTKKCLVLDCDNTLWGGVIGEDGMAGIKLGVGYPGVAFQAFQRQVLSLQQRGVILALCSKNNEQDVWEIFDKHPDMILKREHISAWRINWEDKATNLRAVAQELNIGLDSLVFCDDSEFETGLVRDLLPDVTVMQLPPDKPSEFCWMLAASGLFDQPALSEEDRNRGAMYTAERQRKQARAEVMDMDEYMRSLEVRIQMGFADAQSIPRIAQQTQKTNQFNLTTKRYAELDITQLSDAKDHDVVWCRVADKLGDMGIIGSCIVKYEGEEAHIDTFLMSCRALGRKIEIRFLAEIVALARNRRAKRVVGRYIPTPKNSQVEDFFPCHGFRPFEAGASGEGVSYAVNIDDFVSDKADWFESVTGPLSS